MYTPNELDIVKEEWNTHYIRKSNKCKVSGVPDELYYLPHTRGYEDCGIQISEERIAELLEERDVHKEKEDSESTIGNEENEPSQNELRTFFQYVVDSKGLEYPSKDWHQAKKIYTTIIDLCV